MAHAGRKHVIGAMEYLRITLQCLHRNGIVLPEVRSHRPHALASNPCHRTKPSSPTSITDFLQVELVREVRLQALCGSDLAYLQTAHDAGCFGAIAHTNNASRSIIVRSVRAPIKDE